MSENRRDYGVKIVGVYPVARKGNGYVFCTPRTAKSECAEILRKNGSKVVGIHGLADEIERAVILGEKPDVKPFFDEFDRDAEYVSLGCTHYGFIKEELSEIFPRAKLIDGNDEAENEIRSFLSDHPREGGGGEVCFIGKKSDIIAEIYAISYKETRKRFLFYCKHEKKFLIYCTELCIKENAVWLNCVL